MKTFLMFMLLLLGLGAEDFPITQVDDTTITIEVGSLPVGTSAIVLHRINANYEAILALAEVVSSKEKTLLKLQEFKSDKQDALPKLTLKPAVGDRVRLNWMYERAMVIAPNLLALKTIETRYKDKTFVHPDLFVAYLSDEGHPSPLKEDFQYFCRSYDLGLLFFYVKGSVKRVDCNSFKVLDSYAMELKDSKIEKPMYSRIKKISADWWGEGSDPIKDYDAYYLKLLEGKDDK